MPRDGYRNGELHITVTVPVRYEREEESRSTTESCPVKDSFPMTRDGDSGSASGSSHASGSSSNSGSRANSATSHIGSAIPRQAAAMYNGINLTEMHNLAGALQGISLTVARVMEQRQDLTQRVTQQITSLLPKLNDRISKEQKCRQEIERRCTERRGAPYSTIPQCIHYEAQLHCESDQETETRINRLTTANDSNRVVSEACVVHEGSYLSILGCPHNETPAHRDNEKDINKRMGKVLRNGCTLDPVRGACVPNSNPPQPMIPPGSLHP